MSITEPVTVTAAEYLGRERVAREKHEYRDGFVVAMVGASREHNLLALQIGRDLSLQLRGKPCETYGSDMHVHVPAANLYAYPNVVVVCGAPEFADAAHLDTLLNPTLLVEVLSPSTEAYDRGRKSAGYRTLPSLQAYLLVSQDEPRVELFAREAGDLWVLREAVGREAELPIGAIGCTLSLRSIYERVLPDK